MEIATPRYFTQKGNNLIFFLISYCLLDLTLEINNAITIMTSIIINVIIFDSSIINKLNTFYNMTNILYISLISKLKFIFLKTIQEKSL